jgi:hypothetical protein
MQTITVRIPDVLVAEIKAESRLRKISVSDVVRERLQLGSKRTGAAAPESIADLIGSVKGLPPDLSALKKSYLKATGYGQRRHR